MNGRVLTAAQRATLALHGYTVGVSRGRGLIEIFAGDGAGMAHYVVGDCVWRTWADGDSHVERRFPDAPRIAFTGRNRSWVNVNHTAESIVRLLTTGMYP